MCYHNRLELKVESSVEDERLHYVSIIFRSVNLAGIGCMLETSEARSGRIYVEVACFHNRIGVVTKEIL